MKKSGLRFHALSLLYLLVACQKEELSLSVNADPISSTATVAEGVYAIKNTEKFSDTSAVAKRKYGIVITGNSLVNRMIYSNWKITWLDKGYPILDRGIGGTTWGEKIPYLRDLVTTYHPYDIILYDGENEFLRATANDQTVAPKLISNFNRSMDSIRAQNPNARVYVVSMITCPVLLDRKFSEEIDAVNVAYQTRVSQDAVRYPGKSKFIDIRSLYRSASVEKFEADRIHIKLSSYTDFYNALKAALPKINTGAWEVPGPVAPPKDTIPTVPADTVPQPKDTVPNPPVNPPDTTTNPPTPPDTTTLPPPNLPDTTTVPPPNPPGTTPVVTNPPDTTPVMPPPPPPPPPPPMNILPIADAGIDISISYSWMKSANYSPMVYGTTSKDPDGKITAYMWTKVSGPSSYRFAMPTAGKTRVENLVMGVYVFRVTVTDNKGAKAFDDMTITVRK